MKTNFGLRIVCLAFWLNATGWVCGGTSPEPLQIPFKYGVVNRINGTRAGTFDLAQAVEKIGPETKVVQVYTDSDRPFPASSLSTIFRRGLGVQFAFEPNFSDKTWEEKFTVHVTFSDGSVNPASCVQAIDEKFAGKQ